MIKQKGVRSICLDEVKVEDVYSEDVEITENEVYLAIGCIHSTPPGLSEVVVVIGEELNE